MSMRFDAKTIRLAVAVVLAATLGLSAAACDRAGDDVAGPSATATSLTPPIKQARWDFTVRPAAVLTKRFTKRDRRRLMRVRGPLKRTVAEIYDVLFLAPEDRSKVIRRRFVGRAAEAFLEARSGVRDRASEIKTLVRKADIGIDAVSRRRAAVRVFIRARAAIDGDRTKVKHRSVLWLERRKGRWVAIGFQVDQEPLT